MQSSLDSMEGVALFCQVFEAKQVFSTNAWKEMYETKRGNRIRYYAKDWVANDGIVKTTVRYECDRGGDATMDTGRRIMENVYNTVIKDFDADLLYNSRGYVPLGSPKKLMKEYVVYDKSVVDRELYEDRGRKHLYEWHHDCKKKQYCDFCREGLRKTSYKRGDFYQVENEEMSCTSVHVSYELLDKFFDKRSRLDKNSKDMMFNTLIPPPISEDADARVRWVYVTELEKDLSCNFISPSTVQDPCWVDYDELIVRLKLTEKARRRRSGGGGDNDDAPHLVDKLNTQCSALRCLNDYMVNFGTGLQPDFSTIKFYLCHWYGGDKEFIANFLSTTTLSLLRECMFQLARLRRKVGKNRADKEETIRPIFSPSCVHLLSALNVVRRSSRIAMDLCDVDLMTERIGSFLGSVLEERDQLLGRCYAKCVLMQEKKVEEGRRRGGGYMFSPQSVAYKMCEAGVENESSHSAGVNSFQSKLYAFQVLMDAYKYLSVGLHHWSNLVCPTCHPTHLMKQELQTMIESVREALPLMDRGVNTGGDPINVERVRQINFMEEKAERDVIMVEEEFRSNSEVHKMIKGCDLVAKGLRVYREHKISEYKQDVRTLNFQRNNLEPRMDDFIEGNQANNAVDREGIQIRQSVELSLKEDGSYVSAMQREEEHHDPKLGYYPFSLSFWTEDECCKVASSFTSIRDDVRYQGCDRSGTYSTTMKEESNRRTTMRVERMTRYHPLPNPEYRRRNPVIHQLFEEHDEEEETPPVIWREQFDSIRKDFESAFVEGGDTYRVEWMNAFGKYWIKEKREWCKDDVEMMRWLMTGANHATVDTCGEHIGSSAMADYKVIGRRMDQDTFDNPSKLLKQELGMQLPLKSIFKLRRDARKFAQRNRMPVVCGVLDPFYWYYDGYLMRGQTCSGCEVLLANNKSSFFDECIVQHFHSSTTVNAANLRLPSAVAFRDIYDLTNDVWNPVTYQHSQMNMSEELMTFAVGGPRFSHNGVLTADTTNNGLAIGVVQDCRHVALAPLFRYHYELPTDPSAKYIDQHMAWLVQMRNQVLRREDPFQDADEYGYVAMQLTHLPRLVAFDAGNMLTFGEDPTLLSEEAVNHMFLKDLNRALRHRTDTSAIVQREPLNEPSVYVVNRRSLLTNKPQVFYNDDSSFVYSAALATNALKWSESMLGDCSEVYSSGELFEPIRTLGLDDVDNVKLCVFGKGGGKDVMFSYCPPVNDDVPTTKNWIFENGGSHVEGLEEVCLRHLSISDLPPNEGDIFETKNDEWLLDSFRRGNIKDWDYVLRKMWRSPGGCTLKTNRGQVLWVKGMYGSGCVISGQRLEDRVRDVDFIQKKLSDMKESLSSKDPPRLTKVPVYGDRVVRLFETNTIQGTAFPIDGVLDETYSNCPEAIMEDVVRMWSIVGGNLPSIGLTMPTFSDGSIDYEPHLVGPAFSRGKVKKVILNRADRHHHNYTGFNYDPRAFLSLDREWDQDGQISTCTTCSGHHKRTWLRRNRQSPFLGQNQMVPRCDRLKPMCVHDDLFAKVPRSNVGLRSRLKSCNTLRCLTMFVNDGRKSHFPPNVMDTMFPYEKLSLSSSCKVLGDFIDGCNGRNHRQVLISRHGMFKDTNRLWRFALFYIEFVFSKGVCMIYDGLNVPGRAKKSSGLLREFSTMHSKHLDVVRGMSSPFKNTRGLLYGEKRELMRHLEHDRVLYSNYRRQNVVLDDDDECGGGLIDEARFHLQRRHAQSNLQSWKLKELSTKFLLLGGM